MPPFLFLIPNWNSTDRSQWIDPPGILNLSELVGGPWWARYQVQRSTYLVGLGSVLRPLLPSVWFSWGVGCGGWGGALL